MGLLLRMRAWFIEYGRCTWPCIISKDLMNIWRFSTCLPVYHRVTLSTKLTNISIRIEILDSSHLYQNTTKWCNLQVLSWLLWSVFPMLHLHLQLCPCLDLWKTTLPRLTLPLSLYVRREIRFFSSVIKPSSKLISTRIALETNARLMALTSKFLQSMANFCADIIHYYALVTVLMVLLYVPLLVLS